MQVSEIIGSEAVFFGMSLLVGMGLRVVYDVFRIWRRVIKHGNFWIGIEDMFYWIFCTIAIFLLLYRENDGMLRLFAFIGILCGMGIYHILLSRYVLKFFVWLLNGVLVKIRGVSRVVFGPFIKIGRKILVFFKKWLKKIYKAIRMGLCKL